MLPDDSIYADLSSDDRETALSVGITLLTEGVDALVRSGKLSEAKARLWADVTARAVGVA